MCNLQKTGKGCINLIKGPLFIIVYKSVSEASIYCSLFTEKKIKLLYLHMLLN